MVPKSLKLEFPKFRGEDLVCWLYKENQYFLLYNTPLNQCILLASYHKEDEALVWFQDVEESGIFTSWDSFVKALHTRFGSLAYDEPMEVLTKLRQTSYVLVYKGQFKLLTNCIKGLLDKHKLSCFLDGLKDENTSSH